MEADGGIVKILHRLGGHDVPVIARDDLLARVLCGHDGGADRAEEHESLHARGGGGAAHDVQRTIDGRDVLT